MSIVFQEEKMVIQPVPETTIKLTTGQEKEGYWVEDCHDRVLVWHKKNHIALLYKSPDIDRKIQDVIEKRRGQLKQVEEKTGWKAD